jgi:hypothetical protein
MLQYTVEEKYQRGQPRVIAKFVTNNDARSFIALKLEEDAQMKSGVIFVLSEMGEEVESFSQGSQSSAPATQTTAQGQGGQGQSSGFRPNPLQTTLRPSGMPPSTFKKDDDKDK